MKILGIALKNLWAEPRFKWFTIVVFIFHLTWQMAWPIFFLYQVNYLHANEAWLSLITVSGGLANILTFTFWGRKITQKGPGLIIVIGCVGLSLSPILCVLSNSLLLLVMVNFITGLTFSAFLLALFEYLMQTVPKQYKTLNIAIYTTLINISGFVAPLAGVWIYKLTSVYFTMYLAGILRFFAASLFLLMYWANKKRTTPTR